MGLVLAVHPRLEQCLLCLCCTGSKALLFLDHFGVLWNLFRVIAGCTISAKLCGYGCLGFCRINDCCCNLPVAEWLENIQDYCTEKSQTLEYSAILPECGADFIPRQISVPSYPISFPKFMKLLTIFSCFFVK